jgi:bis(5'-nucleosidyl)-tetraphosphatase
MTITCGAIIFRNNDGIIEYLLLRAYNNWDFSKGLPDSGDFDLVATAIREIAEETSLRNNLIFITNDHGEKLFYETEVYGKQKKIARFYLCQVPMNESQKVFLPISEELGRPEHDEFCWHGFNEAHKLLNKRLQKALDWAGKIINEKET